MRDVEPVLAAEREEEVVARDAGDLLRLEAEQLADAVILVDDVVADAQVGERRERPPSRASARGGRLRNTCVSGSRTSPSSRQTNPRRAGETAKRTRCLPRQGSAVRVDRALDLAQQAALAQRLAAVRERDDDAVAGAHESRELVLGLGEAAGRDRRPLRLELECLPARERVELRGAVERDRRQPFLLPDRRTSSGCQTKSGGAVDRRDEVVGDRRPPPADSVSSLPAVRHARDRCSLRRRSAAG